MKERYNFLWPRVLLLVWIWLSALVILTGRPQCLWGLLPVGWAEGFWAPLVAVMLTVLVFGISAGLFDRLDALAVSFSVQSPRRYSRLILLFTLYLVLFFLAWAFRSENHFMGDGWLVSLEVAKPFRLWSTAPLNFFILQSFNRLLQGLGITSSETTHALLHCLAFPVFLWLCWRIAGLAVRDSAHRTVLWLLITGTASLQLFFGYVENYPLLHLWIVLYLYLSLRLLAAAKTGGLPWWPTLAFLLAASGHGSGMVLLPSLIFLWLVRFPKKLLPLRVLSPSLLTAACSVILLGTGLVFFDTSVLVPLFERENSAAPYLLFSPSHLWEKFNFLLLICPASLVAWPVVASRWRAFHGIKSEPFFFVFWVAAGTAFFSFVFNPLLGVRDWDLLCLPAVPLGLLAGWALIPALPQGTRRKAFLRALALAAVVHAAAWIWINSDIHRGVRFLDRIAEADYHRDTGKFNLASMLHERDFLNEAIRQYRLATPSDKSKRHKNLLNMGDCFLSLGMPDSTIHYLSSLENIYVVTTVARMRAMLLSLAFDMQTHSDSATSFFLNLRRMGLELKDSEAALWGRLMSRLAEPYEKLIQKNPADIDALLFFLRYYTLKQEEEKFSQIYDIILTKSYSLQQWNRLLDFAGLCNHQDYFEKMLDEALRQHPHASIHRDASP